MRISSAILGNFSESCSYGTAELALIRHVPTRIVRVHRERRDFRKSGTASATEFGKRRRDNAGRNQLFTFIDC